MEWKQRLEEVKKQTEALQVHTEELMRLNESVKKQLVVLEKDIKEASSPFHARMNQLTSAYSGWSKVKVNHDLYVVASQEFLEKGIGQVCMMIFEEGVTEWSECAFHLDRASGVVYPLEASSILAPVLRDNKHYTFFPPSMMLTVLRKLRDDCNWKIDFKE